MRLPHQLVFIKHLEPFQDRPSCRNAIFTAFCNLLLKKSICVHVFLRIVEVIHARGPDGLRFEYSNQPCGVCVMVKKAIGSATEKAVYRINRARIVWAHLSSFASD